MLQVLLSNINHRRAPILKTSIHEALLQNASRTQATLPKSTS
jgi:hypothetical protein